MKFPRLGSVRPDYPVKIQNIASYYKNLYLDLNGCFHALPFDSHKEGLWLFDGQVFYQEKKV